MSGPTRTPPGGTPGGPASPRSQVVDPARGADVPERSSSAGTTAVGLPVPQLPSGPGTGAGAGAGTGVSPQVHLLAGMPMAACLLDRAGLVRWHNRAFAELLQRGGAQIDGEPFLTWIARAGEREGFGRGFLALRDRDSGAAFTLDVALAPGFGPASPCRVKVTKLPGNDIGVICVPREAVQGPEADLGWAVIRGLDALNHGVLMVNPQGQIVHMNPAAIQLLGDGLGGCNVLELAEGPHAATLGRALSLAQHGSWQGELTLRRRDGERLPVELSVAAGSGPAVVLIRDLRDRRRREFEARVAGQVDRCLVSATDPRQSVAAACAVLAEGVESRAEAVLVSRSTGWERWELSHGAVVRAVPLGRGSALPDAWEHGGLEVLELGAEAVRVLTGVWADTRCALRVPLRGAAGIVGQLILGRSHPGSWEPTQIDLIHTVAPSLGLGLGAGLLTLATRELAAYQAMVLDQTAVLIDTVDAKGRVVTWNRASEHRLGVPAAEAVGRRLGLDVGVAQVPGRWEALWSDLLRDGAIAQEIALTAADGSQVPLHLEGRLLREGERVLGAVFVGLDLRDRRALERQILRSQKLAAVGLLAAGIAHEINNPLSGVVGYSKLLLERPLAPEIRERVEKIAQSGERCRKIVEGVLLFSRQQEAGQRRMVDVAELLNRVLAIGEYQWRMHNVRILRELEPGVQIMADADQLEQVVLNLLSNAVDAMPRGGTVRLGLHRRSDGGAILTVTDEGSGIAPDIQSRIFDPFFSTKEIGKGTGLGLAISYGIVQDHGGDILVESAPGKGTTFTVTLPPSGEPDPRALDAASR